MAQFLTMQFTDDLHYGFLQGDPEVAQKHGEAKNIRSLQELFRALACGDLAAFSAGLAEDIEMEILGPPTIPFSGRWQGRQQVVEAVRKNFAMLEDQQPEVQSVVAQGDTVVFLARERGRYRATGKAYEIHFVQFFTFRGGKVIRFRELADSAAFLEVLP